MTRLLAQKPRIPFSSHATHPFMGGACSSPQNYILHKPTSTAGYVWKGWLKPRTWFPITSTIIINHHLVAFPKAEVRKCVVVVQDSSRTVSSLRETARVQLLKDSRHGFNLYAEKLIHQNRDPFGSSGSTHIRCLRHTQSCLTAKAWPFDGNPVGACRYGQTSDKTIKPDMIRFSGASG